MSKRTWITPEDLLAIRYDLYDTSLTTYDISSLAKRPRNIKPRQAVHVLIVCKYLGLTSLPKGYVVHHKNLKRNDNRISNLYYHTTGIYRKTGAYPACKRTAFGILPDSYQVE